MIAIVERRQQAPRTPRITNYTIEIDYTVIRIRRPDPVVDALPDCNVFQRVIAIGSLSLKRQDRRAHHLDAVRTRTCDQLPIARDKIVGSYSDATGRAVAAVDVIDPTLNSQMSEP